MFLRFGWIALQAADTPKQHTHDIGVVFQRGYDVLMGSESGPATNNTNAEIKRQAKANGYKVKISPRYDTWVAIKKSLISKGSWKSGERFALWRSSMLRPRPTRLWGDRAIVWAQFTNDEIGTTSIGAVHYLTEKSAQQWKGKAFADKVFVKIISKWAAFRGRGNRLVFVGGDFNKKRYDFDGHSFTTCWEDVNKWPDTGHGNIDAIARYDADGRVHCVGARVFDDKRLFLNTDHYLVEATYEVQALH